MIDKGIPRHGYEVFADEEQIGYVTTGTQSPTLKKNIGLALIAADIQSLDQEVEVQIRGKRLKAKVVPTPFYKRKEIWRRIKHETSLFTNDRTRSDRKCLKQLVFHLLMTYLRYSEEVRFKGEYNIKKRLNQRLQLIKRIKDGC